MERLGNNSKGIDWDTSEKVEQFGYLNYKVEAGSGQDHPSMNAVINAIEAVLMLALETNGHVAVKAWAMYHAQEKLVNILGSENSGTRGSIHNSVTRAILKPTHYDWWICPILVQF